MEIFRTVAQNHDSKHLCFKSYYYAAARNTVDAIDLLNRISKCELSKTKVSMSPGLFQSGVEVDTRDKYFKTPLMASCAEGNITLTNYLLSLGCVSCQLT